eukprot:snap_masked-scaffold_38-processed-gene-2.54-mRNA-1 protein AED:1.00 eAED:1.00 QI:0/-1/0/0/-1/1/1/0/326
MKIGLVGPGAVGLYYASKILKSDLCSNLFIIGRKGVNKKGKFEFDLTFPGSSQNERFSTRYYNGTKEFLKDEKNKEIDALLVTLKSNQTSNFFTELFSLRNQFAGCKSTLLVSLQNGLGNVETMQQNQLGPVIGGIVHPGIMRTRSNEIKLNAEGPTYLCDNQRLNATMQGKLSQLALVIGATVLNETDFHREQWKKVMVNCVVNPICSLLNQKNGVMLEQPIKHIWKPIWKNVIFEILDVAEHEAVDLRLNRFEAIEFVQQIIDAVKLNECSMLQDVRAIANGSEPRQTEIGSLNGYIVKLGKKHNLDMKYNKILLDLINTVENQ